ncbi:hypothetical protein BCR39DRAFT_534834 [Naematelia encephala]|uniref:SAP domain-containing protein n=1 Tax=Naematelia encephala TaxID=71784 RepID=A0A1Y2B315_9TREE|nr:hypothetical protein BCR39DRAFT_534834 [Naematelia encephala]
MIRRKLSNGLLRTAAQAQHSAISPAKVSSSVPLTGQSANLASAVMLSTTRNWKVETTTTLKAELKRRGLSQVGNKTALIDRLSSAETSASLGPVPPLPRKSSKQLSTTSSRALPPKRSASPARKARTETQGQDQDQEPVTSAGPPISSQKTDAPSAEPVRAEQVTVAPGLPETADVGKTRDTLDIKMPQPEAEQPTTQSIPFVPDNYRSNALLETVDNAVKKAEEALPKVMTVASASTHPAGGPTHGVHSSSDAHTHEVSSTEVEETVGQTFGSFESTVSSLLSAPVKAATSAGLVPAVGWPKLKDDSKSAGEYKADPSEPLNEQEKTGAWALAGLVGLGLWLGGPSKKTKGKGKKSGEHQEGNASVVAGTKGDAKWEQASGAGIVGHGGRKD